MEQPRLEPGPAPPLCPAPRPMPGPGAGWPRQHPGGSRAAVPAPLAERPGAPPARGGAAPARPGPFRRRRAGLFARERRGWRGCGSRLGSGVPARRDPARGDPAMAVPAAAEAVPGRQRALAAGSPVDYMSITSFPRLPEEEPSGAAESGLRARKEEDAFLGEQDTGEGRRQSPPAALGTPRPSAPRSEWGSPGSRRPCALALRSP